MPRDENFSYEIFQIVWSAFFKHKQADPFQLTQRIKIVWTYEIHHLKALRTYNSKKFFSRKFHVSVMYNSKFNIGFNRFLVYCKNPGSCQKKILQLFSDYITFVLSHAENSIEKYLLFIEIQPIFGNTTFLL